MQEIPQTFQALLDLSQDLRFIKHESRQYLQLGYVYTLRLIGPISYSGECDLMVYPWKYIVTFSRMHFVTFVCI